MASAPQTENITSSMMESATHSEGVYDLAYDPVCLIFHVIILITICILIIFAFICVLRVLIGGCLLIIYKLRPKKTKGLKPSSQDNAQPPTVYENDQGNLPPYENVSIEMRPDHKNPNSLPSQSTLMFQMPDPATNQSDSHSHYQHLNPKTQANSIYHTLHS
ncbi:uncharacterized protein Hap1MRO34_024290 [Clarias gariepinus]